MKKEFLGFAELNEDQKKDLKILIDKGVFIREVKRKGTAEWEKFYLAEFEGVGIEFDFSHDAEKKEKNRVERIVWEEIQNLIKSRNKDSFK